MAELTITLYQAGAGSGKTYRITEELVHRLIEGTVRPQRVLATTFTRKAAAELKDRIQQRLLHPEKGDPVAPLERRLELAADLDQALIGTVHSVGHRLLSRYALQLGISPQLEPIEEKAQERHLRRIFAEMPSAGLRELEALARRFGTEKVQQTVLELLDAKRANAIGDDAFRAGVEEGVERLIEVMGGGAVDLPGFDGFYDACEEALARIEGNDDETKATAKARRELEDLLRRGVHEWQVWGKVARLKWAKKSAAEVASLTALARRANVHSRLHADLRAFASCLVDRVLELQASYRAYKSGLGLVDFTDLEERFLELLSQEDLDLDLVVVDEFQDTNPVQLALFQALAGSARASLWVGDEKQAIYGFRGTDPALMADVVAGVSRRETLGRNWRSDAGLVRLVNRVFTPLFGAGTSLEPQRSGPGEVQHWRLQGSRREERQGAFVRRMQALWDSGARDVAVLVRKNDDAKAIAAALRAAGVPSLVQTSGLLSTREGAMLLAGLRLVADPKDRLAAASLRHVADAEGTPAWFRDALRDPEEVFAGLEEVRAMDARTLPPSGLVGALIQALGLPDRILEWGTPSLRAANLDALLELGARYEDEAEQEGKAATVTGLVYWLEALRKKGEDLTPVPAGVDAVQIMTLWKAKGLEWSTVVLYLDGSTPPPDPFSIQVTGGNAREGRPLEGRQVRYWPYPFGRTYMGGLNADGSGIQQSAKESPEGLALHRQAEQETRRLLYVGFTRAKSRLVVAEGGKHPLGLIELEFQAEADGHEFQQIECEGQPEPRIVDQEAAWFDEARGPREHVGRYWSPSKAPSVPCETRAEPLPGPHPVPRIKTEDWTSLGQAVHAYLAALPALKDLPDSTKAEHAQAALRRWGQEGVIEAEALVKAGKRLEEWVEQNVPGTEWYVEVPVAAPRAKGGQWSGTADLLLRNGHQTLVVDHKSADFAEGGWDAKAQEHAGQLWIYVEVLGGKAMAHLPLGGGVVQITT